MKTLRIDDPSAIPAAELPSRLHVTTTCELHGDRPVVRYYADGEDLLVVVPPLDPREQLRRLVDWLERHGYERAAAGDAREWERTRLLG